MLRSLLPAFALLLAAMSAFGQGTGLTGQYYDTATFGTLKTTRTDAEVDFNWGTAIPSGTTITNADTFSVAWTGQIEPEFSELYTFYVMADDGARLWIDDRLVTLRTFSAGSGEMRGQVALSAGKRVNIRLEYIEQTGSASVRLEWSAASRAREVIPAARMYPARVDRAGGSLLREHWSGLAGASISTLTSNANYPNKPSGREFLTSFECLAQDWADSYGTRVTGFIVAPATGSYVFAVSGNDVVQLYMSTDATAANKALIASTTAATAFRQWNAQPSQQSAPRNLVQGQRYYVELLHKEDTGADHWSVGWQKPGDTAFSVVPGSALLQPGITNPQPAQTALLDTMAQEHPRIFVTAERFAWLKAQWLSATASKPKTWAQNAINSANTILTQPASTYTPDVRGTILGISNTVESRVYNLALAWWLTNDPQYAERAWTELDAAAAFPDWHPAHFLDTAEMSHAFAIGYDWLYNYWTPARRTTIRTALINKGLNVGLNQYTGNAWWSQSTANNWNLVCNGGLALGALAVGTESEALVEDILNRGLNSTRPVLRHFTTDNGNWYEGPGYWGYTMEYSMRMMAGLEAVLGSDYGLSTTFNFADSGWAAMHSTGPSNVIFNYADAGAGGARRGPEFFWLARRFGEAAYAWHENQGNGSVLSALWYQPAGPSPQSISASPDMGFHGEATTTFKPQEMITMRGRWGDTRTTFVAAKGGEMGASHGNLDAGTFVLDALGRRWFHDLGGDSYALSNYFNETPNPNGVDRWDYYRMRAEGQNTLVINPGATNDMVLGQVAPLVSFQSEPNGSGSFTIHDLTPVYSGMTRVWRGVRLFGARDQVLVQDEIQASTGKTVWWFAHYTHPTTSVVIDPDGTSATLTQGADRLWCKIVSGGATFQTMDAVPLPTSPNPAGQNANAGFRKLAINLTNVTNTTLAVWFVPLPEGAQPPVTLPAITPLNTWNIATVSDPPTVTNGSATLAGDNAVDIDLRGYVTDDSTPPAQMRFSVSNPANGTVVLLPDGHTARFTPAPGYTGVPQFQFTATDTTPDPRALLAYDFDLPAPSDPTAVTDVAERGRDGLLETIGTGAYSIVTDVPAALGRTGLSLDLAENGGANAARLSRVVTPAELNFNTSDWTIAGWFKRRDTASDDMIFHLNVGDGYGTGEELYLILRGTSSLELHHYPGPDISIPATPVNAGTWYHFAVVRSGTTMSLYLNGVLVGSDNSFALAIVQTAPLIFGGHTDVSASFAPRWFDGRLDELAVYADDLTPAEIGTLAGGMTVRHFGGLSATGTITLSAAPATYTWSNNINGTNGLWSTPGNWLNSTPPVSSRGSTVQFFTSLGLTTSTVTANNNLAAGFQMNVLALGGTSTTASNVTIAGNSIQLLSNGMLEPGVTMTGTNAALTYDVTLPITLGSQTTFNGTGAGNFFFSGPLTGAGGVTRVGTGGRLVLSGNNSYAGDTIISAGTLQIGNDGATGTLGAGDVVVDGTLRFDRTGTLTVNNNISGDGGVMIDCPAGGGTIVFSGNNSFAGMVNVNSGALRITNSSALGEGSKLIRLNNGTNGNPQLRLDGSNADIELPAEFSFQTSNNSTGAIINEAGENVILGDITLTGGGGDTRIVVNGGSLTLTGHITLNASGRNLRLNGSAPGIISGPITDGLASTNTLSVLKADGGTWTLSGPVSCTGSISVTGGSLIANGTIAGPSSVAASVGTSFGGSGSVACLTVISGNHAPGASLGTQTFASTLTYGSASRLQWELGANSTGVNDFDQVSAATVTVTNGARLDLIFNSAGSSVDFTDAFWATNRSWPAVLATTMTGTFQLGTTSVDSTGRSASGFGTFSLQQSSTGVNLVWTAASSWQQWQALNFGASWNNATIAGTTADPDRDGFTNEAERIFGMNPNAASVHPLTIQRTSPTQVTLSFSALEAAGTGYVGLTRRYTLEWTTDIRNAASWQAVPGYQAIAGSGQVVVATEAVGSARFYRLRVWLE